MKIRMVLSFSLLALVVNSHATSPLTPKIKSENFLNVSQEIKPNDRQEYHNSLWFEVGAKCKVNTFVQKVHLKLELKKGSASINGTKYKSPHVIEAYEVNDKDKFSVLVAKHAKVAITLLQEGETKKIKADCSVSL